MRSIFEIGFEDPYTLTCERNDDLLRAAVIGGKIAEHRLLIVEHQQWRARRHPAVESRVLVQGMFIVTLVKRTEEDIINGRRPNRGGEYSRPELMVLFT